MRLGLALIAMISVACGIDTAAPRGGGDGTGTGSGSDPGGNPGSGDPGEGSGPVTEVSGHIAASTTWRDTIHVVGSVVIDPGVTLTVVAGTTVDVSAGAGISVFGTLDIEGIRASKAVFRAATTDNWPGFAVPSGGVMTASYLVAVGGGIAISETGSVTLVDSQMSHASHDFLTMNGGTLNMTYSAIGVELGQTDTSHCDMHVGGPVTITATHSNFSTAAYGLMFYGGQNADFRYTNWFGNSIVDIDATGYPVTGDFSNSYFANGAPTHAGFTLDNLSDVRVGDAGVR